MTLTKSLALGATALLLAAGIASAQHTGHGAPKADTAAPATAREGYEAANARMHRDMAIRYSGNADADFVRGMIPHHQGAIDMAKVVQKFGKDAEVRKLAGEIIKAQEAEIALMRGMLKRLEK
jgi:uncharacterized protein (DUF305 family)